jgi:hypothetical protein
MKYFNLKTTHGVETVDQININDFKTWQEYKLELRRLIQEYRICGMDVYISQRACKDY